MDHITKSLQCYLKTSCIKYNAIHDGEVSHGETSTLFDITSTPDNKTISILINISSENHTIVLWGYPHIVSVNKDIERLKDFVNEWNGSQMFSTINITKGCITEFDNWYSVQLFSKILSDAVGLTRSLWHKYIEALVNETIQIWDFVCATGK